MFEERYKKLVIVQLLYALVVIIFLIRLNHLNQYLLEKFHDRNPIELLGYNNYEPIKYFLFALVLGAIGGFYIFFCIKNKCYRSSDVREILVSLITIPMTIVFMILLLVFINNPILQAIFLVMLLSVGVFSWASDY